ncbi:hypothetical protein VR7878_00437 [Vibrio ruber DSM 16370]|uniref:DUF4336 domain-containing protein n=1 Tax=Vibrio ruber (strain DSM 16370 / JCM 11486 / BCRC 17186 / CECT 7878 / LMG 23124 / VR1) TaxID=1123498 RepID=A0A1R4LB99_VIBR1|nr:DUF4336 domain-containing protein [Vibrio ruber]SJN53673.1 hypothetical protein VR7878_00437 [Vibrio ruber DSM 16370]
MKAIGENIWIFDGKAVPFLTLPYSTRMTIVRLADQSLWVHSPIELNPELKASVDTLGVVKYLIAPNQLHHLFISQWQSAYPEALSYGTEGVRHKRQDLTFNASLSAQADYPWADELDAVLFTGSQVMQECVFFHRPSETLIVTDLIENFSPKAFNWFQRLLAKLTGILAPTGKMPLDWRLSFLMGKATARTHLEKILNWEPRTIVMAHGVIVTENADQFLRRSFRWLL